MTADAARPAAAPSAGNKYRETISGNILLVFNYQCILKTDAGDREVPGSVRGNQASPPGPRSQGSNAMTASAAPQGTSSTLPPPSPNGSDPKAPKAPKVPRTTETPATSPIPQEPQEP